MKRGGVRARASGVGRGRAALARSPRARRGGGAAEGAGGGGSVMASGRGASSRWFFTREQLENTPSRRCGVEADIELSYRQQAANLIQEMGQRLNVYPLLCLALHCSRPVPTTRRVSRAWCPANMAPVLPCASAAPEGEARAAAAASGPSRREEAGSRREWGRGRAG